MKNSKLAALMTLQILAQAVLAQQEPQQPVQYAPQQQPVYDSQQQYQNPPQQPVYDPQQQQYQYPPQQYPPQQYAPQQYAQQQPVPQGQPQAAQQDTAKSYPANTITIDFGPTIIGSLIGSAGAAAGDEFDISGFGWGAQYERQIFKRLSVAGRFAYLGISTKYTTENDVGDEAKASMDLSSFSLEVHPRVYPFGGGFFLDGMLGYADMSLDFKGEVWSEKEDDIFGNSTKSLTSYKFDISRSYFKYGLKLGWRADFGEPGGFIFEHSYGYYWASGSGDTMTKQLQKEFNKEGEKAPSELDDAFSYFEDFIFIGGPRVTLAFGWKF